MKRLVSILCLLLAGSALVFGQATATINGRVVDPADAVVPNAAVTVTNLASGVARETTTNAEGLYSVPALNPGNYGVKVQVQGFDTAERKNVELLASANLSLDFKMTVGSVQQSVEVGAQAALVETSQAVASASIRQTEVQNLPMLNRTMGALMSMLPGAREVPSATSSHGTSANFISVGGGTGHNFNMVVDGIDNKEDHCGGIEIVYSLEGIQEFKLLATGANAEYGRGTANAIVATKSGGNEFHGTGFFYFRNQDLVKTDFFSIPANGGLGKAPFSRKQYGGSLGGPIIKDKLWFFGSVERTQQAYSQPRSQAIINQLNYLIPLNIGVKVSGAIAQPSHDLIEQGKVNYQFNSQHSVFARYSAEKGDVIDAIANNLGEISYGPYTQDNTQLLFNAALGETWVVNPTTVNQFTAQWISLHHDTKYPPCNLTIPSLGVGACLSQSLVFPSVQSGQRSSITDWNGYEHKWQFRDDISKQMGRHALKFGIDYAYVPTFGGVLGFLGPGTISFFDDPSVIATNTAKYPQGFQTPGAIRTITQYDNVNGEYGTPNNWEWAAYGQDDFKLTPRLTLNFGLRWDAYNLGWDTPANQARNPTYQILKAVGSPYGKLPATLPNMKNFQPRFGVAWDVRGDGRNVVRVSYGIFYLNQLKLTNYSQDVLQKQFVQVSQVISNSAFGQGALANFRYGIDPLPPIIVNPTTFLPGQNAGGVWYDPNNLKDAQNQQFHGGWSHAFSDNKSVLAVDFTYMILHHGWRTLDINPLLPNPANPSGPLVRPLTPLTQALYGDPKLLSTVYVEAAVNTATYNETIVHYENRFSPKASVQLNYILAWSRGYGGNSDGAQANASNTVNAFPQIASATGGVYYAPWEWGPSNYDERNRITAIGVFSLPFKIDVSPSGTFATARPYTLYRATNPSGDGSLQLLNAAGNPAGINTQRGSALFVVNTRITRNFTFGRDGRFKVAGFAELYNITNRANFGNVYGGNQFAPSTYQKPTGYLGGAGSVSSIPNSFQVQFGGRFSF